MREGVGQDEAKRLLHQHRIEKLLVVDDDYRCVGLITVKDIEKAVANPNACKDEQGRLRVAAATTVGDEGFERTERLIDGRRRSRRGRHRARPFAARARRGQPHQAAVERGAGDGRQRRDRRGREGADRCRRRRDQGRHRAGLDLHHAHRRRRRRAAAHRDHGRGRGGAEDRHAGDRRRRHQVFRRSRQGARRRRRLRDGRLAARRHRRDARARSFSIRAAPTRAYRGMGSVGAMARGSADRYFQQDIKDALKLVPEGIEGQVPYKGPVADRAAPARRRPARRDGLCRRRQTLDEFREKARFVRISAAGLRESHVHDVTITRESPNYPGWAAEPRMAHPIRAAAAVRPGGADLRAAVLDGRFRASARSSAANHESPTSRSANRTGRRACTQIGNAFQNQLELPVLFYVLTILAICHAPRRSSCSWCWPGCS